MKRKKKHAKTIEPEQTCVAGIPIEKCSLKSVKQSNVGKVYLADNSSRYLSSKSTRVSEPISIPKKTIKVEGTPVIYVYRGYLMIDSKYLIDYYMILDDIRHKNKIRVVVAYNLQNQHYYMSIKQLENLHKKQCFPDISIRNSNEGSEPLYAGDFRQYSELGAYGYKVGNSGLPKGIRQEILAYIIDKKILRRFEIISLLNGNITLREGRMDRDFSKAISDWEDDIKFVNDYCGLKQLGYNKRNED